MNSGKIFNKRDNRFFTKSDIISEIKKSCSCINLLRKNGDNIYFCQNQLKKSKDIDKLCEICIKGIILELIENFNFFRNETTGELRYLI